LKGLLLVKVAGQMQAVELAKALRAKVVVPMNNGDLDLSGSSWLFKNLVKKLGTVEEFRQLLREGYPSATVNEAPAGVSVAVGLK
jgi:L-ascorbate metabolism protein UlaG (beta-lactamase superfamily)